MADRRNVSVGQQIQGYGTVVWTSGYVYVTAERDTWGECMGDEEVDSLYTCGCTACGCIGPMWSPVYCTKQATAIAAAEEHARTHA